MMKLRDVPAPSRVLRIREARYVPSSHALIGLRRFTMLNAAARALMLATTLLLPQSVQAATANGFVPRKARPFSDKFTKDTSLDPRWTLAEPNPGSSYSLGTRGLVLDASALNGGADLWPLTNYNASLLLQPISSSLNWTVTTKIAFQVTNNYMGAGLVLTTQ
ncbi:MAG TPA: hypothetical protein VMB71_10145, partial [Acetobacteraceae bacterium]|nr:hypothetical protein [Acetobacteraceae bacterium]